MKAIIVDDDRLTALDYEIILRELRVKEIKSVDSLEGITSVLTSENPDFIILDVHLGSKSGLSLIPYLRQNNIPTIVVTGFPSESLTDLHKENIVSSLLIKPVNEYTLKYEVLKIINDLTKDRDDSYIYYKGKNKMESISFLNIYFIETERNYTTFYTNIKKHVIKKSLKQVQNHLPPEIFIKVFRSILINLNYVKRVDYSKNTIELENGRIVPLGLKFKKKVRQVLESKFDII